MRTRLQLYFSNIQCSILSFKQLDYKSNIFCFKRTFICDLYYINGGQCNRLHMIVKQTYVHESTVTTSLYKYCVGFLTTGQLCSLTNQEVLTHVYMTIFGIEGPSRKAYIQIHTETLVTCSGKRSLILCWNSLKITLKDGGKIMLVC